MFRFPSNVWPMSANNALQLISMIRLKIKMIEEQLIRLAINLAIKKSLIGWTHGFLLSFLSRLAGQSLVTWRESLTSWLVVRRLERKASGDRSAPLQSLVSSIWVLSRFIKKFEFTMWLPQRETRWTNGSNWPQRSWRSSKRSLSLILRGVVFQVSNLAFKSLKWVESLSVEKLSWKQLKL